MVSISVIIPTYRDWGRLAICIKALNNQTFSKDLYEVIIVNNDPADLVPAEFFLPQNFKIITENKRGSYAARNTGIKLAEGEILAFTDSDCVPCTTWLQEAYDCFTTNPGIARISGKVELTFLSEQLNLAEIYESVHAFKQQQHAENGAAVTANMFAKRLVFNKAGLFDESLYSGGDIEWGMRANKCGCLIIYSDKTVVKHPARTSLKQIIRKSKRVAGGITKEKASTSFKKLIHLLVFPIPIFRKEYIALSAHDLEISLIDKIKLMGFSYYLRLVFNLQKLKQHFGYKPYQDV